ncbi:hypothetical protein ACFQMG_20180 [Kitasatospora paranensis]|uniref:Uncharacterized protein n=1 Tax=Kitasatospora paranensis TaxID=258053 RepID=A0ABW2G0K7_9ACTN
MTSTPYHRTRRAARAAVLGSAVLLAALTALPAAAAGGDPAPAADGVADVAGARQVLQSGQVRDTVGRFLVATRQPGSAAAPGLAAAAGGGTVGARGSAPAAPAAPPAFDLKDPVPLYELSPDFVAGTVRPAAATVARVAYLASRVTAADGHRAAVLLAPRGTAAGQPVPAASGSAAAPAAVGQQGWQLAGIRDGDTDVSLAEQGTPQSRTFTEPQINAWYRLTPQGAVEPLNREATTGLGGRRSVTLAAYQKLVAARYGDKLPGSAYARKGLAGGYGLVDPTASAGPAAAAGRAVAGPSPAGAPGPWMWTAVGGGAALAAGAVVALRRRSAARG